MIAVFCKSKRDFDDLVLTPKKMFKRVVVPQDLIGINFTGAILYFDWYKNRSVNNAYEWLLERQPELFDRFE